MSLELLVIGLHRVGKAPPEAKIKGLFIAPKQLEFYLSLVREMGFEFATLRQAVNQTRGKFAVVTFDDGYADNLEIGFPILRKFDAPATVFIITGDAGGKSVVWSEAADDLPADLLSWTAIKYLQSENWEIGSHSCEHRRLSRLSESEQEELILHSTEEIRRNLGAAPLSFAYPYGDFQPATKRILKNCGINYAVTTQPAKSLKFDQSTDLLEIPRVSLGGGKTRHYLKNLARLTGAVGFGAVARALFKMSRAKFGSAASGGKLFQYFKRENYEDSAN